MPRETLNKLSGSLFCQGRLPETYRPTKHIMPKLSLPQWHTPEQVRDILLELPETKRNRALYELIWQFGHDNPQGIPESEAQLATLRLLWQDPRIQGLENIKLWLKEVLYSDEDNGSWLALQPEIETLLDVLHPETCGEYGEHGGMRHSAATLEPFVVRMIARNTENARYTARCCLYWNEALCRQRPDFDEWLQNEIRQLHEK
ncbi:MAG: hypothetical protein E7I45_13595 [Eikenella corrodens]|uniref:hypothetical protein n=1 Tax=Eikenella corrodens TaxID=539 RepID=UPI0029151ADF|nr:hypothetical protein [Eikenella corrodens]MDU4301985.1 hypothetical protein [Eikenella corrodens]